MTHIKGVIMKRNIFAVILIIFTSFCVYGQNTDSIDLVLVLNTSAGMSSSYENVNNYITGGFLSEFMRTGDTFHLIPFSASPRLDSARQVFSLGDVETIIGRMLLQYPIESGSNVVSALTFAENYVLSLPARPKKIVLVSTGDSEIDNLINALRQRIGSSNTTVDFIQVIHGQPLTNLPKSGRPLRTETGSSAQTESFAQRHVDSEASQASTGTAQASTGASQTSAGTTQTTDTTRTTFTPETQSEEKGWQSYLPYLLGLLLLLLLIGLIIFLISRRNSGGSSTDSYSSGSKVDHSDELAKYAAMQNRQRTTPYSDRLSSGKSVLINPTGPLILNLFVEEQSVAIGKRNIHSLKSGYSLSVGGKNSDFLIFLVPMPSNLGELRRNGSQLSFIPRKYKYFPDLGSNELRDCLNKTIRVISDKGYELRFRFEMYEDPLVALNRILHSIKVPG